MKVERIIISRTDSIGDVVLTLPICNWIKKKYPSSYIIFLGRNYTVPILSSYNLIDEVCAWDDFENLPLVEKIEKLRNFQADTIIHVFPRKEIAHLAYKAKIKNRIGTSHRSFHLLTCNYRLNFTRKRSDKHEAQLNFELLKPLGCNEIPTFNKLIETTSDFRPKQLELSEELNAFIENNSKFIVLHPKSQGSALEWPLANYIKLTHALLEKQYGVIFSGTEKEGVLFRGLLPCNKAVLDTSGMLSLEQLMSLIAQSKGLVACSTGPLHIAALIGVATVGLFSPKRPIHPGRWQPIGKKASYLVFNENCKKCREGNLCNCIERIAPQTVLNQLQLLE